MQRKAPLFNTKIQMDFQCAKCKRKCKRAGWKEEGETGLSFCTRACQQFLLGAGKKKSGEKERNVMKTPRQQKSKAEKEEARASIENALHVTLMDCEGVDAEEARVKLRYALQGVGLSEELAQTVAYQVTNEYWTDDPVRPSENLFATRPLQRLAMNSEDYRLAIEAKTLLLVERREGESKRKRDKKLLEKAADEVQQAEERAEELMAIQPSEENRELLEATQAAHESVQQMVLEMQQEEALVVVEPEPVAQAEEVLTETEPQEEEEEEEIRVKKSQTSHTKNYFSTDAVVEVVPIKAWAKFAPLLCETFDLTAEKDRKFILQLHRYGPWDTPHHTYYLPQSSESGESSVLASMHWWRDEGDRSIHLSYIRTEIRLPHIEHRELPLPK
jgi:hypothetical protein